MKKILFLGLFITYAASAADLVSSRKRKLDMGSLSQDGAAPKAPGLLLLAAASDTVELSHKPASKTEGKFECLYEGCDFRTDKRDRICSHLAMKHKDQGYLINCPYCIDQKRNFSRSDALLLHCRDKHPDVVNICGAYSTSMLNQFEKKYNEERQHPKKHDNIKMVYNPDTKLHTCIQCGLQDERMDRLEQHIFVDHEGGKFRCPGCNKKFARPDVIKIHLNKGRCKSGLKKVRFEGFIAIPVEIGPSNNPDRPMEVHSDVQVAAAAVDVLESNSDSEIEDDELMIIDDESDTAGPADDVTTAERVKAISRPEIRDLQVALDKPDQLKLHCSEPGCEFVTTNIKYLCSHFHRIHELDKAFKCDQGCNKSFADKIAYEDHMRGHRGEYLCCDHIGCEFRAQKYRTLQSHKIRHGEASFKCDHPGCEAKPFHMNAELKRHKLSHLPMSERRFACTVQGCLFRSNSKTEMAKHMASDQVHQSYFVQKRQMEANL